MIELEFEFVFVIVLVICNVVCIVICKVVCNVVCKVIFSGQVAVLGDPDGRRDGEEDSGPRPKHSTNETTGGDNDRMVELPCYFP